MADSLGRRLLKEKVRDLKHGEQHKLADQLGISDSLLSAILAGARKPGATNRASFEDVMGIPWRAWDQRPEKIVHRKAS